MIIQFKFRRKSYLFKFVTMKLPDLETHGKDSMTEDLKYVLFFDFDKIDYTLLKHIIDIFQTQYFLSNFYIFDSGRATGVYRGYHAVCLDKFTIHDAYEIIKHFPCEQAFIDAPRFYNEFKSWVLRDYRKGDNSKPVFIETLKSPWQIHQQSSAHAGFLRKEYGIPIVLHKPDNLEELGSIKYRTYSKKKVK